MPDIQASSTNDGMRPRWALAAFRDIEPADHFVRLWRRLYQPHFALFVEDVFDPISTARACESFDPW